MPDQYAAWLRAALAANQADPFCCAPLWQMSFHWSFAPERRLLVETAGESLVAFAENVVAPGEVFLTPPESSWCFGCPVLGKEGGALFAAVLRFFARSYAPSFPRIILSGLRPETDVARTLLQPSGLPLRARPVSAGIQCAASLEGGLDGFLSRRSANHRRKLRRAAAAARQEGIVFERVLPGTDGEAQAVYARMLAVERASWKGIGHCGMAEDGVRQFYALLLETLAAARAARVIFARREERDIGFIFGGLAGTVYRGQQFSYAQEWRRFSVGNLMQLEQIAWLCEEGASRYDMGPLDGPRMDYKAHWTELLFPIRAWIVEKA